MKIVTLIGVRSQFKRASTLSRGIARCNTTTNISSSTINEVIVHTGQHYDAHMFDILFEQRTIPKPDYHLGSGGGSHEKRTGRQLEKIEEVFLEEKPDRALVYGATNSTLAATDKPRVTLRDETQWVKLAEVGANGLAEAVAKKITDNIIKVRQIFGNTQRYCLGGSAELVVENFIDSMKG